MSLSYKITLKTIPKNGKCIMDFFDSEKQRVACVAHILNIAVQEMLGAKGLGALAPNAPLEPGDEEDGFEDSMPNDDYGILDIHRPV
ncbi:hypothetical protein BGZ81_002600 [Podila clonocystis]|nr:hypothetical protein BGZ81_002600 [Podila clonocystis]